MYACCANCQSSTWIEPERPTCEHRKIACGECSQSYVVNHARELGNTAAEHYRAIVKFSGESDIDMPCAYSVLLGVMPLAQAKAIRRKRVREKPAPRAQVLPDNVDPAFHRAVTEGSLTIHEALSRGDREAFVTSLVKRHELPRPIAFEVADNRIGLRKAMRLALEQKRREEEKSANPRLSAVQKYSVVGIAALLLAVVTGISWSWTLTHRRTPLVHARAARPATPAPAVVEATPAERKAAALARATRVHTDDEGRILEIVGPDPGTVLRAYCESFSGFLGVEAQSVRSTTFPEARLGVFKDYKNGGALRSIRIRLDARSGRWVAGTGKIPIRTSDASELPPDGGAIEIASR